MFRERTIFNEFDDADTASYLTDKRKQEIRQEMIYTAALETLINEIADAVEESGIRNDGDSIRYVLQRVWERFEFLAPPDLKSLTD